MTNSREKQFKRKKNSLHLLAQGILVHGWWALLLRAQTGQNITVLGTCGGGDCWPHSNQEAERVIQEMVRAEGHPYKGPCPWLDTILYCFTSSPLSINCETTSVLVHWLIQSLHDEITSSKPVSWAQACSTRPSAGGQCSSKLQYTSYCVVFF